MLGYSVTDRNLINSIEYSLVEPITTVWSAWSGTEMFSMSDLTRAIERRRNQFLGAITTHITHSQVAYGSPPGTGRISLSDSFIDIHRVSWKDVDGSYTPLYKTDERESSLLLVGFENSPSTPQAYSTILQPPKGIQVIPRANDIGTLDILSINNPADLDESVGVLLNVPDDWSWVIKWGALADLLGRDSQAYNPARSKYCETRFEQGLQLALTDSCIYQVLINGVIVTPQDLKDFDYFNAGWQNISGQPTDIAIISRNLIALSPVPDSNEYSIELNILRNIPIPSLAGDFLQVGKEQYDLILDYAFHLAMFKCQGVEFQGSYPMLDRFMQGAMLNNDKLRAVARDYSIMRDLSKNELIERPRMETDPAKEVAA